MLISNLNKIVSLFLIGGLGLTIFTIIYLRLQPATLTDLPELPAGGFAVFAGFIFLTFSSLLGIVIESASDLTIRILIRATASKRAIAVIFCQAGMHDDLIYWSGLFRSLLRDHPLLSRQESRDASNLNWKRYAAGVLYQHAPDHRVDWILSHYSTYYLASCCALVLLTSAPFILWIVMSSNAPCLSVALTGIVLAVCFYLTLALAADRFLYTYMATYRYAALWLAKQGTREAPPPAAVNRESLA